MKHTYCSYGLIGYLGKSSRQNVQKSGNAARWLMSRVRRMLVPPRKGFNSASGVMKQAVLNRDEYFRYLDGKFLRIHKAVGLKRKSWGVDRFIELMGLKDKYNPAIHGTTVVDVFKRIVNKTLEKIAAALRPFHTSRRRFWVVNRILDDKSLHLPRFVNKVYGKGTRKQIFTKRRDSFTCKTCNTKVSLKQDRYKNLSPGFVPSYCPVCYREYKLSKK